jgi:hypothetical protein
MIREICLFLAFSCVSLFAAPYPYTLEWSPPEVAQGGVVKITLTGATDLARPEGTFDGKKLRFWHGSRRGTWIAWGGADLDVKPPMVPLVVTAAGRKRWIEVPAIKGHYREERLTLPKQQVSPAKPEVLKHIREDRKKARAAGLHLEERPFAGVLQLPCKGRLNRNFGKRRILNGIRKSPHGGEDISAPKGREVRAAASGVIRLVADMFYSGNTLFVDHGSGWMTTYFHLSEVLVHEGQEVDTETVIGKVGSTGRATGPHLHWGLQWLRSRVDPLLLVPKQP